MPASNCLHDIYMSPHVICMPSREKGAALTSFPVKARLSLSCIAAQDVVISEDDDAMYGAEPASAYPAGSFRPGRVIWAKVEGHDWWPARVVRRRAVPREVGPPPGGPTRVRTHIPVVFFTAKGIPGEVNDDAHKLGGNPTSESPYHLILFKMPFAPVLWKVLYCGVDTLPYAVQICMLSKEVEPAGGMVHRCGHGGGRVCMAANLLPEAV